MGAIAGAVRVLDEGLIEELGINSEEIDAIANREQAEIRRQEELFRGGQRPLELCNRSVILVDDGLAMGTTMAAAARFVERLNPARVTIAVPVGSLQARGRLLREADDVICLATPEPFIAVGRWYRDFGQVSDAEVQNLLAESRHLLRKALAAKDSQELVSI